MKSQSHKDKIVVVGTGNVGEAIAYTLMVRAQANDIVLIDLNDELVHRGRRLILFTEPVSVIM